MRLLHLFLFAFCSTILIGQTNNDLKQEDIEIVSAKKMSKKVTRFTQKGLPKKLNKAVGELVFIPGGTFNMGQLPEGVKEYPRSLNGEGSDTFLISIPTILRRVTVSNFIMGATEVTNAQYREFVYWVRDSVAHQMMGHIKESPSGETIDWDQELDWSAGGPLGEMFLQGDMQFGSRRELEVSKLVYISGDFKDKPIRVYPDTLCWLRDFSFSYNEPMTRNYFWHPDFDHFPVVGVSWDQAVAYCDWKSGQINKILTENGYPPLELRLPTEAEWEYAALNLHKNIPSSSKDKIVNPKTYPWDGWRLLDEKGNYLANFGRIFDETGQIIKSFPEEDKNLQKEKNEVLALAKMGIYTTTVKQFPIYGGLYGMSGNVTEWVIDVPRPIGSNFLTKKEKIYDLNPYRANLDNETTVKTEKPKYDSMPEYIWYKADSAEVRQYLFDQAKNNKSSKDLADPLSSFSHDFENYWRDLRVIFRSGDKKRIGKGGSWAESQVNLSPGARACYTQSKSYSFVGFRVAAAFKWP